jgi:O-antigen ligase/Tfp pilus assembly protein PilF
MTSSIRFTKESSISLAGMLTNCLVLLGLIYLILISSSVEGLLNPILLSILLLIYLFTRSKGDIGIEIPSLAFILVLILTSITSIDPRRSFYEVWLIGIGIFLIFFATRIVQLGFSSHTLIHFLLLIGLGFMIFSWWDASKWYLTWRSSYPEEWIPGIAFRLNGGNTIAAYYHGILMIGIARLVYSRSRLERIAFGAYCLSAALLVFLSSSRGAYLGVLGGLLILVVLQWGKLKKWVPTLQSLFKRFRILILGASFFILLVIAAFGYWYLQNMQSHPTHGAALQSRDAFWRPAWQAFLQSPWIGNGPYTFASEYMQSASVPPSPIFYHAHNTYLDVLSGSGLLGLPVSIWLVGTLIYQLWRSFHSEQQGISFITLGALLALFSFLVHSIFDGLYLMPFAAFNLCILLGAALGEMKGSQKKWALAPMGLGVAVVIVAWVNFWMTAPYNHAIRAAKDGDFELASEQFALATQRDPGLVLTHQQLGLAESVLVSEGDQPALDRAIQAMEEAVRLDPSYSPNPANLGALYRERGELEQAAESFTRAIELAPEWSLWHLNLGEVYELQEKWDLSTQNYEETLSLESSWSADGFWTETPFRNEFLRGWQASNPDSPEVDVQYTEAEVVGQSVAAPILEFAAQKIQEQDFRTAERLLGIVGLTHFRRQIEKQEWVWLNAEIAASKEEWSNAISLGENALDGFRFQGAYGPGGAGQTLYGTGIFRRSMMDVELVPQLTLIRLPDPWDKRMVRLAGWYQKVNDSGNCTATMDELLQNLPDFWGRFPELELDCSIAE